MRKKSGMASIDDTSTIIFYAEPDEKDRKGDDQTQGTSCAELRGEDIA
jgi:hypothetical protein